MVTINKVLFFTFKTLIEESVLATSFYAALFLAKAF